MSIRLRLAVVFALSAAVLFALGSWLFVARLSSSLLRSVDSQLTARLGQADRYVSGSRPITGTPPPGEFVVQVLDPAGRVRGGSAEDVPTLSATTLAQARNRQVALTVSAEDERQRVVAAPLARHPGWVAVAAVSLEATDHTLSDVTRELVVAGVVVVAVAGIGAYTLARSALSPVERLRREVAGISARDPAPRVRIPRTHDEIAALATTMNELLSRLDRALRRQRALVADASHGLRTPFAVLRGELELAGRPGRSREELTEAIAHATDEVARLARITEQLLFLARSDEDRIPPQLEHTDIGALLAASVEHAAQRAVTAGVDCRLDVPAGLTADVDPARLREAVDNLIDNALRFAPAGTSIVVSGRAAGADLEISVRDSGPGFPPEFLPQAFERFARPNSGGGGAGLGLAIVSAIAGAHGGQAVAANRPGGGAEVTMTIPRNAA